MIYLIMTMAVFALATAINTASVVIEQKGALLTRFVGSRAWYLHLAVITPAWVWFLALARRLGEHADWPLPPVVRPFGVSVLVVGVIIFILAFRELGFAGMANGYFFGRTSKTPVRSGVYRLLKNPMYDSYAVILIGVGLYAANAAYLLLAGESMVLLNLLEARVENRPFEPGKSQPNRPR